MTWGPWLIAYLTVKWPTDHGADEAVIIIYTFSIHGRSDKPGFILSYDGCEEGFELDPGRLTWEAQIGSVCLGDCPRSLKSDQQIKNFVRED